MHIFFRVGHIPGLLIETKVVLNGFIGHSTPPIEKGAGLAANQLPLHLLGEGWFRFARYISQDCVGRQGVVLVGVKIQGVHSDTDVPNRQATASTGDVQVVSAGRLDLLQRDGKFTPSFARLHIFRDLGGGVLWCAVVLATLACR